MERLDILLVDDDLLVRHVIADEIAEAGHFVLTVACGEAALEALADNPAITLVLVDYAMPGMMGPDLIREIRNRRPDLKVAMLTGYAEILRMNERDDDYPIIAKGLRMEELIKAVEAAARGEATEVAEDAASTRVEMVLEQMAPRPAVEGIQRQLYTLYERTLQDNLPQPLTKLLDKLGDGGTPPDPRKPS